MAQLRAEVIVNVVPDKNEPINDYCEQLKIYVEAAAQEIGNVVQVTAVPVVSDEILTHEEAEEAADSVQSDQAVDPMSLIEKAAYL